jgi:hypothetical protein
LATYDPQPQADLPGEPLADLRSRSLESRSGELGVGEWVGEENRLFEAGELSGNYRKKCPNQ